MFEFSFDGCLIADPKVLLTSAAELLFYDPVGSLLFTEELPCTLQFKGDMMVDVSRINMAKKISRMLIRCL